MPICPRCNKEFTDSIPKANFPEGNREVASFSWCSDCNAHTMSIIFRDYSVYRPLTRTAQRTPVTINIPKEILEAVTSLKRNTCSCGKIAYVWNGRDSLCFDCSEKASDYERGYAFDGIRQISLRDKYGKEA